MSMSLSLGSDRCPLSDAAEICLRLSSLVRDSPIYPNLNGDTSPTLYGRVVDDARDNL
jgi:hypothetical protein